MNKNYKFNTLKKRENGSSIIFFVMFILPVLSFLLMLSFEVASIYVKKRKVQDVLDDAALLAIRYYPYTNQVRQVAQNYIEENLQQGGSYDIDVLNGVMEIRYNLPVQLIFSQMAGHFMASGVDTNFLTWNVGIFTSASPQVEDYMILLDRSKNVAPQSKTELWENEVDWPTSTYVNNEDFDNEEKRFFTQQCFNPVFNSLKEAAISLYNYLGNFALNQVGFMVTPGENALREVNYLLPMGAVNFNPEKRGWRLLDYEILRSPTQEDCYNIAKNAKNLSNEDNYNFFDNEEDTQFYEIPLEDKDEGIIPDFSKNVSFQRNIWSLPSHSNVQFSFDDVLTEAINQTVLAPNLIDRHQKPEDISKTLIFLTPTLPNVDNDAIRTSVKNICKELHDADINVSIKVVYALYNTRYVPNDNAAISTFRDFFKNLPKSNGVCDNITFSLVESKGENIMDEIFQYIQINKKRGHIWR